MKIEAGKRYIRRDGTISPPLVTEGIFLLDTETDLRFSYYTGAVFSGDRKHPGDLMSEWEEPVLNVKQDPSVSTTINDVLDARGNNYGEFHNHAAISQELSDVMANGNSWPKLSPAQREALQMIQHKIARILNGDPSYLDSWVDIIGYAELGKRETERLGAR